MYKSTAIMNTALMECTQKHCLNKLIYYVYDSLRFSQNGRRYLILNGFSRKTTFQFNMVRFHTMRWGEINTNKYQYRLRLPLNFCDAI